ncbi:MAG: serine hydrolase domain-containing protein [Vicinamibacterales bacterium]
MCALVHSSTRAALGAGSRTTDPAVPRRRRSRRVHHAHVEDKHAIGVSVGVMQDGRVIFNKGFGLSNTSRTLPVTTDTIFAIGSITKQLTCAVALQLEEEGKLSFDQKSVAIPCRPVRPHRRDLDVPDEAILKTFTNMPLDMAHTRFEPVPGAPGLADGYTPIGLGAAEQPFRKAGAGSVPPAASGQRPAI